MSESNLSLVLVGPKREGKSASGNTILGEPPESGKKFFDDDSPTLMSKKCESQVCGRKVTVVDTPGLSSSELSEAEMKKRMNEALTLCAPHMFLITIQLEPFKQKDMNLAGMLSSDAQKLYSMVLFTYGDKLKDKTIEEFIRKNKKLGELIKDCGGRYHVFSNNQEGNKRQVCDLLGIINCAVRKRKEPCCKKV